MQLADQLMILHAIPVSAASYWLDTTRIDQDACMLFVCVVPIHFISSNPD